jgi:hypothetical protein
MAVKILETLISTVLAVAVLGLPPWSENAESFGLWSYETAFCSYPGHFVTNVIAVAN